MATMLMTRTSRARAQAAVYCHDQCDGQMTRTRVVKKFRRRLKRVENRFWKRNPDQV